MKRMIMISTVTASLLLVSCGSNNTKEAREIKAEAAPTITQKAPVKEATKTVQKVKEKAQKVENKAKKAAPPVHKVAQEANKTVEQTKEMPKDAVHNAIKKDNPPKVTPELAKFYTIFDDGAQIAPKNDRPLLLVFGQPADPYTQKLQNDVTSNEELAALITENTTPIYVNAAAKKMHKFIHNGDMMDVDTKTLIDIYHLEATPTLIFMDDKSQSIFMVPGYMPPKQFEVTIQFVKDGAWKGKDRKNGEVYQALKDYYKANGVEVGEPKK